MLLVLLVPLGMSLDLLHVPSPAPGVGIPALGRGECAICLCSALSPLFSRERQIMSRAGGGPGGGGQATRFLPWPESCALTQGRLPGRWFASVSGEMWIKTQPIVHYKWKE